MPLRNLAQEGICLIASTKGMVISVKPRSLNAQFYVSNKILLNSSKLIFKLEQWQVEVESTERKVKRLKSEDYFWYF